MEDARRKAYYTFPSEQGYGVISAGNTLNASIIFEVKFY